MATPSKLSFVGTAVIDLEAKAADGSKLPKFKILGYTGAVMNVFSFFTPVIVDLGGLKAEADTIPALLDHDTSQIVGQANSIDISSSGVQLEGVITGGEDPIATRVITHAKNGFKWQASIGASIVRREFLAAGEKATVNGRDVTGPLMIAREARLYEISFVALGADSNTSADVAAKVPTGSLQGTTPMTFEQWLQARGIDPAGIVENVRTVLKASYDAEVEAAKTPPVHPPAPAPRPTPTPTPKGDQTGKKRDLAEIVEATRKEEERVDKITALTESVLAERPWQVGDLEQMSAAAIDTGMSSDEYEVELLRLRAFSKEGRRATRRRGANPTHGPKVIEAAICMEHKLNAEILNKSYDQATLNAASDRYGHGLGLQELLLMAARENGYTGTSVGRNIESVLRHAFRNNGIHAEFSTIALPGIFGNVANKFLLQGYNAVETAWRPIAAITSVNNFLARTSYSLTGDMEYAEVGPTGEIKHGKLGEESYTNQAKTYARMFAITRTDIINDDLGALTRIPSKLGRGAALKLNKVFWTAFLSNANTFFSSGHANISSGAGSALGSAGLSAASTKFKKQVDADGQPTAIMPKFLVVPAELEITADELMSSTGFNSGGAATGTQIPNRNVWTNKYQVVSSVYLSDSTISGSSAVKWYLLADPNDVPVIEVAFLNGKETPTVEQADADFNLLGVQFRGFHDFGVSQQDYRGAVRSEGS